MKTLRMVGAAVCAVALCFSMAACSDDDDDENGGGSNGNGMVFTTPSSVVDGCRVAEVQSDGNTVFSATYNADGTVASATVNGAALEFEYSTKTRAESPRLLAISAFSKYANEEDRDYFERVEEKANNFVSTTDGFLASCKLYYKETSYVRDSSSGNAEMRSYDKFDYTLQFYYNSDGRLDKIAATATEEWYDAYYDETETDKGSGYVYYSYNGGSLSSVKVSGEDGGTVISFDYGVGSIDNVFNIYTPDLSTGITGVFNSYILYFFCQAGYLGNSSARLPSKATLHDAGNKVIDISYKHYDNFAVKNIIRSAIYGFYGMGLSTNYSYVFYE